MNRFERSFKKQIEYANKEVLTIAEVAEIARVSRPTVMKHIKSGEWPAAKHGGKWFVPRAGFLQALKGER